MDSSELASEGLLPHSSCCEPESSWKPSFSTASFWTNTHTHEHGDDVIQELSSSWFGSRQLEQQPKNLHHLTAPTVS